jgi:hypothetical protein
LGTEVDEKARGMRSASLDRSGPFLDQTLGPSLSLVFYQETGDRAISYLCHIEYEWRVRVASTSASGRERNKRRIAQPSPKLIHTVILYRTHAVNEVQTCRGEKARRPQIAGGVGGTHRRNSP